MAHRNEAGFIFLMVTFCHLVPEFRCQILADPIRNTLGLWSRLLNRMAQREPPTDEQLHFKVTPDQLPSFHPLFKSIDSLNLLPMPLASERSGKPGIINEEILYHLLPPLKDQKLQTTTTELPKLSTSEAQTTIIATTAKDATKKRKRKSKKTKNQTTSNATEILESTTMTVTKEGSISTESPDIMSTPAEISTTTAIMPPNKICMHSDSCSPETTMIGASPTTETATNRPVEYNKEKQENSFTVMKWTPGDESGTVNTSDYTVNFTEIPDGEKVDETTKKTVMKEVAKVLMATNVERLKFVPDIKVHFRVRSNEDVRNAEENPPKIASSDRKDTDDDQMAKPTKESIKAQKATDIKNTNNSNSAEEHQKSEMPIVENECRNGTIYGGISYSGNVMSENALFIHCNDSTVDESELTSNNTDQATNTANSERSLRGEIEETLNRINEVNSTTSDSNSSGESNESGEQTESEQSSEEEANESENNTVTGLSQLDKSTESEASKSETSSRSGSTISKPKGEIPEAEEDNSPNEHGSSNLNLIIDKEEVSTSTVLAQPSSSAQAVYNLQANAQANSNPAQSNVFTPVNSIIDGIGPLILPLLGYSYNTQNGYYPYMKRTDGVTTYAGNRIGNEDGAAYADDSIVGLSTAIAREIYNNARARQAAGQLQQAVGHFEPTMQPRGLVDQPAAQTANSAERDHPAEKVAFKPPTIVVTKQQSIRPQEFGKKTGDWTKTSPQVPSFAAERGTFKAPSIKVTKHDPEQSTETTGSKGTRMSPQVLTQTNHHLSPMVPSAQPLEPLQFDSRTAHSTLSEPHGAQFIPLSSNQKTGKSTKGTTIIYATQNPTSKVLLYPRFMPNPSEHSSRQTSSEELQQGSALLQNEFSRVRLPPSATAPILNNEVIVAANNVSNMSPLFVTGRFTPSATNQALQYSAKLFDISSATAPPQWSQQLAARVATALSANTDSSNIQHSQSLISTTPSYPDDVGTPYNRDHPNVQSPFLGDSGLAVMQLPSSHDGVPVSSGLDTGFLRSSSNSAMKFGSFGNGRAPEATYEESISVSTYHQ